jgi:hypothetical protein
MSTNKKPWSKISLVRFGVRAVRVTASTVAIVALLQQHWIAGISFGVAWLLILGLPRVFPVLAGGETP